jgi:hypothetical protein
MLTPTTPSGKHTRRTTLTYNNVQSPRTPKNNNFESAFSNKAEEETPVHEDDSRRKHKKD